MKLVIGHAAALLLVLVSAYVVWTEGDAPDALMGEVVLWSEDAEDVTRVTYEAPDKRAVLEPREDGAGSYVWVTVALRPGSDTAAASTAAADSVLAFVGDDQADALLEALAEPRALRELGEPDAEGLAEYGLADSETRIVVEVDGETHELAVGGIVFASGDRYVLDRESGSAYVLAASAVSNLASAEGVLIERRVERAAPERVGQVTVRTERGERTMTRGELMPDGSAPWLGPEGRPDPAFATFMDRVGQLMIQYYEPELDTASLTPLATLEYADREGEPLQTIRLLRRDGQGEPDYYLISEHTRGPARAYRGTAEPVAQDLAQLF